MRPSNIKDVASSVVKGMSRSINRSAQPTEYQTREGRRKGSRKGATLVDGKSPIDYLKMLEELQGFPEEREIIASGDENAAEEYLKKDAQLNNQTYEEAVRSIAEEYDDDSYLGGRKGSRKGSHRGSRKGLTYGELRDMLPTNGDADEEDRIFKEVGFDDTTEEADVFFRALEGDPGSSYIFEQTIGRSGGRKGSRKGATREEVIDEIFDGDEILYDEYLDEMGEYGLANWSIDTWKEYFEKYEMGLDPEGEDKFLEAHLNV